MRHGSFKAHFATTPEDGGQPAVLHDPPLLYNLDEDPSERFDVAGRHPDVVAAIEKIAAAHKATVRQVENQLDPPMPAQGAR